jgi:catechol 2,3-dioxygenase-like lactoylglutathione lyase family enzyme
MDVQLAFYRDVLNCSSVVSAGTPESGMVFETIGYPGKPGARTEVLCVGDQTRGPYLELIEWVDTGEDKRAGPRDLGVARIGFVVSDIEKEHARLVETGADVLNDPHPSNVGNVRAFFFRDPEGNLLEALEFGASR